MKRFLPLLLIVCLLLSACGQADTETAAETEEAAGGLTMYVGLGNTNSDYYPNLHDTILKYTGIDVTLVFNNTMDTTTAMSNRLANNDLPADIMITACRSTDEQCKASLLDLADRTDLTDLFMPTRVRELSADGAVYQLPFTSRLTGFEYNKTLMDEMGWEVPKTFEDMLALKEKCDEAGITFAISGGVATGHGFNYLFNLMGSDFLMSADGAEWLEAFLAGESSVDEFAEAADYFRRYGEAGLFGKLDTADWNASKWCGRERALFYYNILNDIYSYDGFLYLSDGATLSGVTYDENGEPERVADPNGNAVCLNGEYVLYDESNADHAGLERYTIPGAVELHDEYLSLPWISENGANNCFTYYDSMFVGLNKSLGEEGQETRLRDAVTVLEFMTTSPATTLFSDMFRDGFVSTLDYSMDEDRLYINYEEQIRKSYLQPWYYNSFSNDAIVNVGQKVNDFLTGANGVTFDDIMSELELQRDKMLSGDAESLADVTETLDYEHTALLQAISAGLSTQEKLDELGKDISVDAALMPYINSISDIPAMKQIPLVQEKVYPGKLLSSGLRASIRQECNTPAVVRLTGAELREISENGLTLSENYETDTVFPYVLILRGGAELKDDAEYYTAVPLGCLEDSLVETLTNEGRIVTDDEGQNVLGSLEQGIPLYCAKHAEISPDSLQWD